jgi:beta-xylosidase
MKHSTITLLKQYPFNQKRDFLHVWMTVRLRIWGIGILLLSACASTSSATPVLEAGSNPARTQSPGPAPTAAQRSVSSFTNPVYKNDFPDPHIILVNDTYYAYGTTNGNSINIRVMSSKDLVNWASIGDALPVLPRWSMLAAGFTWAPGVILIEDTFVMYYVARDKENDRQCIGVATSDNPGGPFTDPHEKAFICQGDLGGSIDAYPFRDENGKLYLFWKNDGNCCGLEVALWVQELSPDGMSLPAEPIQLIVRDQPWERPLIENPAMVKHNDRYYLFYSGNWWESQQYAVGYAICEAVTGPCEKPLNEPWFQFKPPVMGPGGESFFVDTKGNLWMAYHAWTGANVGYSGGGQRSLHIDLVKFEGDKPMINGPTSTPQLLP